MFGSICYILADREQRREFDPKSDEHVFHGYSINITMYRVFKTHIKYVMQSIYVIINHDQTEVIPTKMKIMLSRVKILSKIFHIILRTSCNLLKKMGIHIMMKIVLLKEKNYHRGSRRIILLSVRTRF